MRIPSSEFIWQGRLHLGDESGAFGDAVYAGFAIELPLTLTKTASTSTATLTIRAENVSGHTEPWGFTAEDGTCRVFGMGFVPRASAGRHRTTGPCSCV
jgi:hypothetical protein